MGQRVANIFLRGTTRFSLVVLPWIITRFSPQLAIRDEDVSLGVVGIERALDMVLEGPLRSDFSGSSQFALIVRPASSMDCIPWGRLRGMTDGGNGGDESSLAL